MSRTGVDFSCIEELQEKLNRMGKKVNTLENKALNEAADIILDEMVNKCPIRTGEAKKHLKKDKIRKIKGVKTIKIGVNKEDNSEAYYLKFYEYGATPHTFTAGGKYKGAIINHPGQIARPFMRPAFENKKDEALDKTVEIIKKGVRE